MTTDTMTEAPDQTASRPTASTYLPERTSTASCRATSVVNAAVHANSSGRALSSTKKIGARAVAGGGGSGGAAAAAGTSAVDFVLAGAGARLPSATALLALLLVGLLLLLLPLVLPAVTGPTGTGNTSSCIEADCVQVEERGHEDGDVRGAVLVRGRSKASLQAPITFENSTGAMPGRLPARRRRAVTTLVGAHRGIGEAG